MNVSLTLNAHWGRCHVLLVWAVLRLYRGSYPRTFRKEDGVWEEQYDCEWGALKREVSHPKLIKRQCSNGNDISHGAFPCILILLKIKNKTTQPIVLPCLYLYVFHNLIGLL